MLEYFKDLLSSSASIAAQRVRNPALGAFALSWCAFNWKSILYLLLSKTTIIDKITYITDNSTWKTVIGYPCVSVIILCGLLPWANNMISKWQSKPLDNSDSIENYRKAKLIQRATRLQRLKAKHDVTYDKVKTGAEKDIQVMKEQITVSQDRMGELTTERDTLRLELINLNKAYEQQKETTNRLSSESKHFKELSDSQKETILKLENEIKNAESFMDGLNINYKNTKNPGRAMASAMLSAAASAPRPDE